MKVRRLVVAAVAAALAASPGLLQGQSSVAVTPFVGYMKPLKDLVESGGFLSVDATAGIQAGVEGELGLSKHFAIEAFVSSTIGLTQHATWHYYSGPGTPVFEERKFGLATNQVGATLIIRPLGRTPSGAPNTFFLEVGAALNMYQVSDVSSKADTSAHFSWNSSAPVIIAGAGLTFPAGRRSTFIIFARYHVPLSAYSSDGLTDWNQLPPPDNGAKSPILMVGVGLRTGR